MNMLRTVLVGAGAAAMAFLSSACPEPADLENPNAHMPSAGATTGGSGGAAGDTCFIQCVTDIMSKDVGDCKLCHSNMPAPAGLQSAGLDLMSPGVTARLKDMPA